MNFLIVFQDMSPETALITYIIFCMAVAFIMYMGSKK